MFYRVLVLLVVLDFLNDLGDHSHFGEINESILIEVWGAILNEC